MRERELDEEIVEILRLRQMNRDGSFDLSIIKDLIQQTNVGNSKLSAFEGRRDEFDIRDGEIVPEFRPSENCSCSSDASTESDGARDACAIAVPMSDQTREGTYH